MHQAPMTRRRSRDGAAASSCVSAEAGAIAMPAPASSAAVAVAPASSSSDSSAAAARPVVLCLGMAFVSDAFAGSARTGTTIAVHRDRARLLALERGVQGLGACNIVSLNHSHSADLCEGHRHLCASFDRRAVNELQQKFGDGSGHLQFDRIYCDYFRFPGEYMRQAYGLFFRSMLPRLIEAGVMTTETELIVPNLPELFDGVSQLQLRRPDPSAPHSRLTRTFLQVQTLSATEYPLYAATEHLTADTLGGFSNDGELRQLHATYPFVCVRVIDCAYMSLQSFQAAFPTLSQRPVAKASSKPISSAQKPATSAKASAAVTKASGLAGQSRRVKAAAPSASKPAPKRKRAASPPAFDSSSSAASASTSVSDASTSDESRSPTPDKSFVPPPAASHLFVSTVSPAVARRRAKAIELAAALNECAQLTSDMQAMRKRERRTAAAKRLTAATLAEVEAGDAASSSPVALPLNASVSAVAIATEPKAPSSLQQLPPPGPITMLTPPQSPAKRQRVSPSAIRA